MCTGHACQATPVPLFVLLLALLQSSGSTTRFELPTSRGATWNEEKRYLPWPFHTIISAQATLMMIDELLVHISAPTTRQSDEFYQSLATAYLEFEPHGHQSSSLRRNDLSNQSVPSGAAAPDQANSFQDTSALSALSAGKESYGSFPSYSSFDGHKTPADAVVQWNHDVVEDDLPPTSGQLTESEDTHHTGTGRRSLRSSQSKEIGLPKRVPDSTDDVDVGFIEHTQATVDDLQSEPQDGYLKQLDGASENETNGNWAQDSTFDASIVATSDTRDVVPERRRSMRLKAASSAAETPTAATPSTVTNRQEPTELSNVLSASLPVSQYTTGEKKSTADTSQIAEPIDFSKLPIDVYPPEPKVSTAQPGTLPSQITRPLAALKKQNPTRFKPIRTPKTPKPDDRGHWLIDCSRWPTHLQHAFWNNICAQISSGKLGWGVTLYREGGSLRSLGTVKLYCWGETVEHTWLVLWLCSKGQVCDSGLKWIDADGDVAFLMS